MPHKNAFIVDADRDFALVVAAALRNDGLKVSISEGDRDPLDEIRSERPDIVLVRAESTGKESGYTLCSRVKRNRRTQTTPVFLYTTSATDQVIETHRSKENHADEYLIIPAEPPYPLEELRERVRNVLFPPPGMEKPPPLPPGPKEEVKPLTQEDTAFIEKVMDSLSTRDPEDLPSFPPAKRDVTALGRRTAADAKLDMLRDKLRQREGELSRVMEMYRVKEREYHTFNERIIEKDVEAQSLKMTIDELAMQLDETRSELVRRTSEFNSSFELLLEEKVDRENELIQVVAGKEKEVADLLASARVADGRIQSLEVLVVEKDGDRARLQAVVSDREGSILGLEQAIHDAESREKELLELRDEHVAALATNAERILRLEETVLDLRGDLGALRERSARTQCALEQEVAALVETSDSLRAGFERAELSAAAQERELRRELTTLTNRLEARDGELETERGAHAENRALLAREQSAWRDARAELERDLAVAGHALESERRARTSSEDSLQAEIAAGIDRIEALTEEAERAKAEHERVQAELSHVIGLRDETIESLESLIRERRLEHEAAIRGLKIEIERLESAQLSAEQALADREAELSRLLDAANRTLSEREATLVEAHAAIDRLKAAAAEHVDRIASLEAEVAEESDRFRELHAEKMLLAERLHGDISRLEAELESARGESAAMEAQLKDDISGLEIELASTQDAVKETEASLAEERRTRASVEKSREEIEENLRNTTRELVETESLLRQTERELSSTRETLALRDGRISEMHEALQAEKALRVERESELRTAQSERDARGAEIGRLEGRITVLDDNLSSLRVEQEELESELDETRQELMNHRAFLAAARAEAAERTQRLEEASRTIRSREEDIANERQRVAALTVERDRALQEREDLRSERDELVEQVRDARDRFDSRSAELADLGDRASELEAELESRGARIAALSNSLEKEESARDELERARAVLHTDLARTEEALKRVQAELERAREEWVEARATLTRERDGVRMRMAEIGTELDTVRAERDEALHVRALAEEQANARARVDAANLSNLGRELETTRAAYAKREEELDAREADVRRIDRELSAARRELDGERSQSDRLARELELLKTTLEETRGEAGEAAQVAMDRQQELEGQLRLLEHQLEARIRTFDEARASSDAELSAISAKLEHANRELQMEREARAREAERLQRDTALVEERLEEATRRVNGLDAEKRALEEARATELAERDRQLVALRQKLDERHAENVRASADFTRRLSEIQGKSTVVEQALEEARAEREDLETRYVREFEEAQESFHSKMEEREAAHARELEELRAQKIELTRQLKTTQLAAQRAAERAQRLEERPLTRAGAEEEFDTFLRQLEPAGSKIPVPAPSASKSSAPRPPPAFAAPSSSTAKLAADRKPAKSPRTEPRSGELIMTRSGDLLSTTAELESPAGVDDSERTADVGATVVTQSAPLSESMADEETASELDMAQLRAAALAGSAPKSSAVTRIPPPPPRRPAVPPSKVDPKSLAKAPSAAFIEDKNDDFLADFDREFDGIKKP